MSYLGTFGNYIFVKTVHVHHNVNLYWKNVLAKLLGGIPSLPNVRSGLAVGHLYLV